jgi:hypothetical protein
MAGRRVALKRNIFLGMFLPNLEYQWMIPAIDEILI